MLEHREPTHSLEQRTRDVLGRIRDIDWMPKFPDDEKKLFFFSKILAKFAETVEVNHVFPDEPENRKALGWVNPLFWLIEEVASTCIFFPPPIKWRQIYENKFEPLDGKSAASLSEALNE